MIMKPSELDARWVLLCVLDVVSVIISALDSPLPSCSVELQALKHMQTYKLAFQIWSLSAKSNGGTKVPLSSIHAAWCDLLADNDASEMI